MLKYINTVILSVNKTHREVFRDTDNITNCRFAIILRF